MKATRLVLLLVTGCLLAACATTPPPPGPMPPAPTAREHLNQGIRLYNGGDFDGALMELRMAVDKDPLLVDAHYYMGLAYEKKSMPSDAERAYRKCIEIDSRYLRAREALGLLLYRSNRFPQAKMELEVAASLNSVMPEVYTYLGEIYLTERNCPKAREMFERALVLNSSFYPAMSGMERYKAVCAGKKAPSKGRSKPRPSPPPVQKKKTFQGGGEWIDPDKF